FDVLLRRIARSVDLAWNIRSEGEVVAALQAVVAKLTEAHAKQTLDALLQQIGNTTDSDVVRRLVGGLLALVPKLTKAQAQHAFDSLVQAVGKTAHPFTLHALATGLNALVPEPAEAQAQQAFDALLQQIEVNTTSDNYEFQFLAKGLQALAAKLTGAQA